MTLYGLKGAPFLLWLDVVMVCCICEASFSGEAYMHIVRDGEVAVNSPWLSAWEGAVRSYTFDLVPFLASRIPGCQIVDSRKAT